MCLGLACVWGPACAGMPCRHAGGQDCRQSVSPAAVAISCACIAPAVPFALLVAGKIRGDGVHSGPASGRPQAPRGPTSPGQRAPSRPLIRAAAGSTVQVSLDLAREVAFASSVSAEAAPTVRPGDLARLSTWPGPLPPPPPPPPLTSPSPPTRSLQSAAPASWSGDLLVLGVFEDAFAAVGDEKEGKAAIASEELKALDGALGGALADIVALFDFKGEAVSAGGCLLTQPDDVGWWFCSQAAERGGCCVLGSSPRRHRCRPAGGPAGQQPDDAVRRRQQRQVCDSVRPGRGR